MGSGFYESQSIMAEKALWNASGLGCKMAMTGSHPHQVEAGKAGQRQQVELTKAYPGFLASASEAADPRAED